jgi:hypothetical protein
MALISNMPAVLAPAGPRMSGQGCEAQSRVRVFANMHARHKSSHTRKCTPACVNGGVRAADV